MTRIELVAIGASWGGLQAVQRVLRALPADFGAAVVVAQHRQAGSDERRLTHLLDSHTPLTVCEAEDKQELDRGTVYVAPADYHLLVDGGRFALSLEERVQYARPSIDVLFESVAHAYREHAIGIVLTGANADGAAGLAAIKGNGGVAVVQDPATATRRSMPDAALAAAEADAILPLEEIGPFLYGLCCP